MTDPLTAAVAAYDEARMIAHGHHDQPMSDVNRMTIAPMILAAIKAYLEASEPAAWRWKSSLGLWRYDGAEVDSETAQAMYIIP